MNRTNVDELFFQLCATSTEIADCGDMFASNITTDVMCMKNWRDILFIITKLDGDTGTAVITVEACSDAAGNNNTAIAYRYKRMATPDTWGNWTAAGVGGFTTTAATNDMYLIWVRAEELTDGYEYVRMVCTEDDSTPVHGTVTAVLLNPRYAEDVHATAIE